MRHRGFPVAFALATVLSVLVPGTAAAQDGEFEAVDGAVTRAESFEGAVSDSGRIARTDPSLLGKSGARPINVMVKLDYDAIASYDGDIEGLAATSPAVTGKALRKNERAVAAYRAHVAKLEREAVRAVDVQIPNARVGSTFRTAYGGFSLRLPENQVDELLALPGVVAVQRDALAQPLAVAEPFESIGAQAVWDELDG